MITLTEFVPENLTKPDIISADYNKELQIKLKEIEGILFQRFNAPLSETNRERLIDILRLFPNDYQELVNHCLYINSLDNFESVYMFFIQRLRKKPKRRKRQKYTETEPPKQKTIYHFRPSELKTDAKTFQYKENSDEKGITDRLCGVNEWNAQNSGIVIVWESKEGVRYIADGHQRLGLANRLKDDSIRLDGLLYKELDGYTPSKVRMISAQKNIAEGTGTPIDTAKIIRELGGTKNYPSDLPRTGVLYQYGMALSRLGEEAFQKVVNRVVNMEQGAVIANIIREDYVKQSVAIDVISKECIETLSETELMARQILNTPLKVSEQTTLFGVQEIIESYAVTKVRLLNQALKELRKSKALMATLGYNAKVIEDNGNILNKKNNEDLKRSAETAVEIIKKHSFLCGAISSKADELAQSIDNGDISNRRGVELFCEFCLQDNIIQIALS